jgi:plasmid stabilization system protein ParE
VKVLWTATALGHLDEIPRVPAEQALAKLEVAAEHPEMYPRRERGRYRGYRWFPVGRWLVFYQVATDAVIVLGILHGAREGA